MRVVTFSTVNRREFYPEVEADELLILAVVATQTQRTGICHELRRKLARVRFVAGVAAEGEGRMRAFVGNPLLDFVMTRETDLAARSLEKARI